MEGWIKLWRNITEWEWFDDDKLFKFFIYLLVTANHQKNDWHGITIDRGQLITSRERLSRELHYSEQQIRTMISKLQKTQEITTKTTNKYTIITICNYDNYQATDDVEQPATQPTNNQQITNNQPTNNQQITTNKNDKNENNDKNEKNNISRFTPPTIDEVKAYCQERKNNVDAQKFIDFYSSKGWMVGKNKMKDWRASVRTWEQPKQTFARHIDTSERDNRNFDDIWN